jgi:hypothetical protein
MTTQTGDRPTAPLAAALERFFKTKTSCDVDGTMSYFAPDLATYTDPPSAGTSTASRRCGTSSSSTCRGGRPRRAPTPPASRRTT